jgi:hypothetical protein
VKRLVATPHGVTDRIASRSLAHSADPAQSPLPDLKRLFEF